MMRKYYNHCFDNWPDPAAFSAFNVTGNFDRDSSSLYFNVLLSELWHGTNASNPGPTFQEL